MASIFENDLILPGTITEIVPDYTSGYDSSEFGTTESITIIGTAFNGPVGRVVPIYSPEHAKYMFGDSFDPKTRREATLVPEIFDAWDRGARTIYAIRVSGQEIFTDYQLAVESELKLRVSGIFPSNQNKEVYMVYESAQGPVGAGSIKVYKPAYRTNMQEKMQGLAESADAILVTEIKLDNYGITKASRLVDVISTVNEISGNNVLRLSLVDTNGADVTASSKDVQALSLGAMFPGIYTIGRDKAAQGIVVTTDIEFVRNEDVELYDGYEGHVWKKLVINTDASKPYPIYGENLEDFMTKLQGAGLVPDLTNEYLKATGAIDKIAVKDTKDYEEVEIGAFDLYEKLGSGFARTAKVEKIVKPGLDPEAGETVHYKVVQTPESDANKVVGIVDGIYSMLENHSTDYTVLAAATAETSIAGKLPKKEEFKKAVKNTVALSTNAAEARYGDGRLLLNPEGHLVTSDDQDLMINAQVTAEAVLNMTCKVEDNDFSEKVLYDVKISESNETQEDILENLSKEKFVRVPAIDVAACSKQYAVENGQLALAIVEAEGSVEGTLYAYNTRARKFEATGSEFLSANTKLLVEIEDKLVAFKPEGIKFVKDEELETGKYIVALSNEIANVYKVESDNILPIVSLAAVAGDDFSDDYTVSLVEGNIPCLPCEKSKNVTYVRVISNEIAWSSYGDMLERFENDFALSSKFVFSMRNAMMISDDFPTEVFGLGYNKQDDTYDLSKYITYTTSDNFARHLAQHCMYASLKTYPTHGIIGCGKLTGVTLSTVAQRVDEILEADFDLYAKKPNGNNMLSSTNMPHPVGRCVSITFMQYPVTTGNGYNYVSNGAAGYGGMVTTLPADRTSTNQPISLPGISFELSNYQLSRLTAKGIVTCKNTTRGLVITDGVTQAPIDSAYRRLSTTKIINIVDRALRETIEPFIGLQDNLATKNSLITAIKSVLNKLSDSLIASYDFRLITDPASSRLGIVKIDYKLVPVNEIREVRNTVSVTAN